MERRLYLPLSKVKVQTFPVMVWKKKKTKQPSKLATKNAPQYSFNCGRKKRKRKTTRLILLLKVLQHHIQSSYVQNQHALKIHSLNKLLAGVENTYQYLTFTSNTTPEENI
jgi:hypothetical protein